MDLDKQSDDWILELPEDSGPAFWFITLDRDVSQSPFGLIDWENMYLWYVEADSVSFPSTKRFLDLSTFNEQPLTSEMAVPNFTIDKCKGLERLKLARDAMGMYLTPRVNPAWDCSIFQYEDGIINSLLKQLQGLVRDNRIMNLKERSQLLQAVFGPDVSLVNNTIDFGSSQTECAEKFSEYISQSIRRGVVPS